MRIGIVSEWGCSLSWWARLADEGHDVLVYTPKHKVGAGIVSTCGSYDYLVAWVKEGAPQAMVLFDASGMGDKADELRARGIPIVGGGSFCDRLEKDRTYGFRIASEAGSELPPYVSFTSIAEGIKYAQQLGPVGTYFKSDSYLDSDATHSADTGDDLQEYLEKIRRRYGDHRKFIIQKKIDGVPLSTARWWNGSHWASPFMATYENKKFMNDDVGSATGCAVNALHFYKEEAPAIAEALSWDGLTTLFRQEHAPPGVYDMNAIVTPNGEAYFLEWTPRLGYDSEMTSGRLIPDLGQWLWGMAVGCDPGMPSFDLAFGLRLTVPPYPWEDGHADDKHAAVGVEVPVTGSLWSEEFIGYQLRAAQEGGGCEVATPEGIVGLAYAQGGDVEDLSDDAVEWAKDFKVSKLAYRTDGGKRLKQDALAVREAGFDTHADMIG